MWDGWAKSKDTKARHVAPCATKSLNDHQVGDHAKEKKHGDVAVKMKNFFKSKSSEASSNTKNTKNSDDNQQTLENTLSQKILSGRESSSWQFLLQYCINF